MTSHFLSWCSWLRLLLPNPFTAKVAIMRLLGSAPKSHLCIQRMRNKVTGLSDLMTLFIDLGCLYCKHTQRAFNVFKNTLNWLEIESVDQKFSWLECGNFSQDAEIPGTERVIAFSQLAVKGLIHIAVALNDVSCLCVFPYILQIFYMYWLVLHLTNIKMTMTLAFDHLTLPK
jgi:hypothetical protein